MNQPIANLQKSGTNEPVEVLAKTIELFEHARETDSLNALYFFIVNRSRELLEYHQAVLLRKTEEENFCVEAISNIAIIQRDAPFIRWVEGFTKDIARQPESGELRTIFQMQAPEKYRKNFTKYSWLKTVWCPICLPDGTMLGVLWLTRTTIDFQQKEQYLLKKLSATYAHHWGYLGGGKLKRNPLSLLARVVIMSSVAILIASFFIPIHLSALAPMEIRARNPFTIASPLQGVVKEIHVESNATVKKKQVLLSFDDTEVRNSYQIAQKALQVAEERLRTAIQESMQEDLQSKGQIRLLNAALEQQKLEVAYKKEIFDRVVVRAPHEGIVVFSDKQDWIGKPVQLGEKIMSIADSKNIEIEILLPIADDLALEPGAKVLGFLNANPLTPIRAQLEKISFNAIQTAPQVISYRLIASLDPDQPPPRIGSKGTAKVYGERVPLILYLFRKPLSTLRQKLGL